ALLIIAAAGWAPTSALPQAAPTQSGASTHSGTPLSRAQVERALAVVKADPNLAEERHVHTLHWVGHPPAPAIQLPAWLQWLKPILSVFALIGLWLAGSVRWLAGAVGWVAESARLLVWVAAALLIGLLVVYLLRLARSARLPPLPQ